MTLFNDLAEHTNTLVALLSIAATTAAFLLYRLINSIDRKVDIALQCLKTLTEGCNARGVKCHDEFVLKTDFNEWKKGREGPGGLWEAINKLKDLIMERK